MPKINHKAHKHILRLVQHFLVNILRSLLQCTQCSIQNLKNSFHLLQNLALFHFTNLSHFVQVLFALLDFQEIFLFGQIFS